MAEGKWVVYLRVSTKRQGRSGLGLEAQQAAVSDFLNGGGWQLVCEPFIETESGKNADRPELQKALAACLRRQAANREARPLVPQCTLSARPRASRRRFRVRRYA